MPHTFISYAREDSAFALQLAQALRAADVEIWLDQLDIPTGARWDRAVQLALETCERFLIILSPASIDSENVQDEIAVALDENKTIVPVLYRDCKTPLRLRRLQRIDFSEDFQSALQELLEDLNAATQSNKQTHPKSTTQPAPKIITPPEDMVLIPAGWFLMGSENGTNSEKPVHKVYVDAFFMDRYQVTVEQYQRFLKATNAGNPKEWKDQLEFPKRPAVFVSWGDAQAYAQWAGKRLPTEAEWEYTARGGYTGLAGEPRYEYPWGDEADPNKANFNADGQRGYEWDDAIRYLKEVGSYPPNGFGLYDMAGNVWEWCADWFDEDYYKNSPERNPQGPEQGQGRVLRGGSWNNFPPYMRCAYRNWDFPTYLYYYVGIRCAQDVLF